MRFRFNLIIAFFTAMALGLAHATEVRPNNSVDVFYHDSIINTDENGNTAVEIRRGVVALLITANQALDDIYRVVNIKVSPYQAESFFEVSLTIAPTSTSLMRQGDQNILNHNITEASTIVVPVANIAPSLHSKLQEISKTTISQSSAPLCMHLKGLWLDTINMRAVGNSPTIVWGIKHLIYLEDANIVPCP